ncbi:CDP-alcohol phosphatidyltransferase family protein [Myxococcota bacterium]|nr:CDP-alcohol phosphatidyltransferase family protein [Myxococcota bacterium]
MFFKAKDLMTVGNISGGIATMLVAMEGMGLPADAPLEQVRTYLFWSGFGILVAFFFDSFDGVVARALKQMNKFGAEFDNVADLVAYSVAPSFLVYLAYRRGTVLPGLEAHPGIQAAIAVVLAAIPVISGSIRFARFNVRRLDVPAFFIGFPRPASALTTVALVNGHLFQATPWMAWIGVPMLLLLGAMNLSLVPFIGHHGRHWSWYLKIILNFVWFSVALSVVLGVFLDWLPRNLAFDWTLFWLCCYLFIGWTDISTESRRRIRKLTQDWNT